MTKILILVVALFGVAAQAPHPRVPSPTPPQVDESNLPESEKQVPPGHYCKRSDVTITPRETMAHHCDCTFTCRLDETTGEIIEQEQPGCLTFCHKNGRRCTCHTEEPCPGTLGSHAGLTDMDGKLVAVGVGR